MGPSCKLTPSLLHTHCSARKEEMGLASPHLASLRLASLGNNLLLKELRWDDKRQQKGQKERLRGQQIKQSS